LGGPATTTRDPWQDVAITARICAANGEMSRPNACAGWHASRISSGMHALSPPPIRGGGTLMIVITLIVLLTMALLIVAMLWRSAWWIEEEVEGKLRSQARTPILEGVANGTFQ
jgi:hypothetical protein